MKGFTNWALGLVLTVGLGFAVAAQATPQTFVGSIGDSICGAKHMMPGQSDKDCTLECVKGGAKYIFIGPNGKIYQLSDQKKAAEFPGAKVKVTGTLKGDSITVASIEAAN